MSAASITATQRSSSSTSDEEGSVSPACTRSAAQSCALLGRGSFLCKKLSCPREGDTGTVAQARPGMLLTGRHSWVHRLKQQGQYPANSHMFYS